MRPTPSRRPRIFSLQICPDAGNQLSISLAAAKGRQLLYSLSGSIEFITKGGRHFTTIDDVAIVRGYGVARLTRQAESEVPRVPAEIAFRLTKPVRGPLSGRTTKAMIELQWPGLLSVPKHRIRRKDHPYAIRWVAATMQLTVLWQPGLAGVRILGHGPMLMAGLYSRELPAMFTFFCLCPPSNPKCKRMCLDIKVGPRAAGGAVMTKDEVKSVIRRVNEIWGCTAPGQCCIEFTVADNAIHLTPAGLPAVVGVKEGAPHAQHIGAVGVARSATCYNVYYVERMQAPPGKNYPGMTLSGANDSSVLVQFPPNAGYTNETLATVTAHELGHALGLGLQAGTDPSDVTKHSTKGTNVMHNIANLGTQLNANQCTQARQSPWLRDGANDCTSAPAEP